MLLRYLPSNLDFAQPKHLDSVAAKVIKTVIREREGRESYISEHIFWN